VRSMTMKKRVAVAAAGVVTIGGVVLGAASLASADPASPSPSASSGASTESARPGGGGSSADTAVTRDELAKVAAAMKAKDSAVTVTSVRKDPDGSYDVLGTKGGADVFYDVSADLKTFALNAGGGHGRGGRGGGFADTAVTGDELRKVTAAMKAKDSAVTVTSVRKDPDGSYDVLGTKAGAEVFYDVSADLKTFTINAHTGR
jgi:hypothetical protein